MAITSRMARITGPVVYEAIGGDRANIPLGPCMVEQGTGPLIDVIWGTEGQNAASLPAAELASAEDRGDLVLLGMT